MNEAGECPRYRLIIEEQAQAMLDTDEHRSVLDWVSDLLAGLDDCDTDKE
jgi:hypothetical protein